MCSSDLRQLRRLLDLVRTQAGYPKPGREWARFTLGDLTALRIAISICENSDDGGRYLVISPLEEACRTLRSQGVTNPLLDVPMVREGRTVFAEIDGVLTNPRTGQMQLAETHDRVRMYLDSTDFDLPPHERRAERRVIRNEVTATRRSLARARRESAYSPID